MVWFPMSYERRSEAVKNRRDQKALMQLMDKHLVVIPETLDKLRISKPRFLAMYKMWQNSYGNIDADPEIYRRF
jgi:hypothetical protein